jgi:hypothetical protein
MSPSAPTFSLTFATQQILHVQVSEPTDVESIERLLMHRQQLEYELARQRQQLEMEAAELRKTYHLGTEPTPGRGYDDRLTMRTGRSRSTLMDELALWEEFAGRRGGLPHTRSGSKYWVSEPDCREYVNAKKA